MEVDLDGREDGGRNGESRGRGDNNNGLLYRKKQSKKKHPPPKKNNQKVYKP